MSWLLRTVKSSRWDPPAEAVPPNRFQPDPLGDLTTTKSRLSVWVVDSDRSNLDRIVAAIAGTRDFISQLDYALVPTTSVAELNFVLEITDGNTPDRELNGRCHRDLVVPSAEDLISLAKAMSAGAREPARVYPDRLFDLLTTSISNGHVSMSLIKANLRDALEKIKEKRASKATRPAP